MNILKSADFEKVLETREKVINVFEFLENKINKLKFIYNELLENHNSQDYVFGIDSLHFQNSLIETEYLSLKSILKKIDNRLYCEYYSLNSIIIDYITKNFENINDLRKLCNKKQFPVYKHLDKERLYNINLTKSLQKNIITLLNKLIEHLVIKEQELENDKKKSNLGLNIDNLVNAENFNNIMLKSKVNMYKLYLETFNLHHMKYYTRLLLKCKLHMGIVNQDIILNNTNANIGANTNANTDANADANADVNTDIVNKIVDINSNKELNNALKENSVCDINDEMKCNILINVEDENNIKSFIDFDKENSNTKDTLNSIISTVSDRSSSDSSLEKIEDQSANTIIETK